MVSVSFPSTGGYQASFPSTGGYQADYDHDADGCLDQKDLVEWLPESRSSKEHSHYERVNKK
jgi:hypothetical protein